MHEPPPPPPQLPAYTQYGRSNDQPSIAPAQPPSPSRRPGRNYTGCLLALGGIVLTIAVCVGGVLALGVLGSSSAKNQQQGSAPTDTPVPTDTIAPTDTPVPTATTALAKTPPIFAPVLGGTVNDFIQRYGQSENPPDNTTGVWQNITVAGHQVTLVVSAAPLQDSQDSQDGQPHIEILTIQAPSGVTWNSSTQQTLMAVFLPSDATFERQQPTSNGFERIYTSAQLAATFTPDLFTNDAGTQTVAPGTLFEQCNLRTGSVQAGGIANSCTISVGEFS